MTERPHESDDLENYEVLDTSDTLAGPPGDDPLDRGVTTPEHWSAAIRSGGRADELAYGESLDELLAEEEPDINGGDYWGSDDFSGLDENAPGGDVQRFLHEEVPDQRAGRLVSRYDDDEGMYIDDGEAIGADAGIDGGGATAEEAAVHVRDEEFDSIEATGEEQ